MPSAAVGLDWASTHAGVELVNVQEAFAVGRECAERLLRATGLPNAGSVDQQWALPDPFRTFAAESHKWRVPT
jgi:hypothetical protein